MGDDYFFAPGSGQPAASQPPAPQQSAPGQPGPGMPGHSGFQREQAWAQVQADAPASVPLSSGNLIAGVAILGSLLMLIGSWGTWLKLSVFGFSDTAGGLHSDLDGRYVLALGIAALLTAGTAMTSGQTSNQVRQICAGVLAALGAIGLIIVVHEWLTISDHVRQLNALTKSFSGQFSGQLGSPAADQLLSSFDGVHIARGWGLWLSGIASSITGLAGAYLFLAKQG